MPFVFIGYKNQEAGAALWKYVIANYKFWGTALAIAVMIAMMIGVLYVIGFITAICLPGPWYDIVIADTSFKDTSMFRFFPGHEQIAGLGMFGIVFLIVLAGVLVCFLAIYEKLSVLIPDNWRKSKAKMELPI